MYRCGVYHHIFVNLGQMFLPDLIDAPTNTPICRFSDAEKLKTGSEHKERDSRNGLLNSAKHYHIAPLRS